jgi:hypothetical protein
MMGVTPREAMIEGNWAADACHCALEAVVSDDSEEIVALASMAAEHAGRCSRNSPESRWRHLSRIARDVANVARLGNLEYTIRLLRGPVIARVRAALSAPARLVVAIDMAAETGDLDRAREYFAAGEPDAEAQG